jgi:hypothetical protein
MRKFFLAVGACGLIAAATPTWAQGNVKPPDLTVCEGVDCALLADSVCSDAGFQVRLTNYTAASGTTSGVASYTYEICSPAAGICQGGNGIRADESCLDDGFCQSKGQQTDPEASCSRECAADSFRGLSHFDVTFPELGAANSCLSGTNSVTGTCAVTTNTSGTAAVGGFVLGDSSCFENGTSQNSVAKCDSTNLQPGDCIRMTVNIAGETNGLGLGAAVVVDKEATTCTSSCLAGPSCDACDDDEDGGACLTRTLGFWGTHPWITNDYDPVTVCGAPLDCNDAADGKSNPSCGYGSCNDVMEGLGSSPGQEGIKNSGGASYVSLVKQLTAAKLNLNATAATSEGGTCSDWSYEGESIDDVIARCEGLCGASQSTISGSGCIEALDAFNNSEDTGYTQTPAGFDRPPVNDFGGVSGADSSSFTAAQGNTKKTKLVVGKNNGVVNCVPPVAP